MATRKTSLPTKNHVLAVSAQLLLTQGYRSTTIRQIAEKADVSVSSVQNFFRSKEGIITELTQAMFSGQFSAARRAVDSELPPVYTYAVETAIQLALTEHNENLRELYIEAYSIPETMEYIHLRTAGELERIFGDRFPGCETSDFYELEIGSAGLMRGYMSRPCDIHFPLRRKIERFLDSSLRVYRVSEEEIAKVLVFVRGLDLEQITGEMMQRLFTALEAHFDNGSFREAATA